MSQARREASERYRGLVEHSPDHVYVIDDDGRIEFMSPAAERAHGGIATHIQDVVERLTPADQGQFGTLADDNVEFDGATVVRVGDSQNSFQVTVSDERENPAVRGLVITARDITRRVALEDRLRGLATEDELTGLPNRRALQQRLAESLARSGRESTATVLLLIDLDGFKGVNDTLGHPVGDTLLSQVAERLTSTTRENEHVARLGGDEFALVIETSDAATEVDLAAARVLDALRIPYEVEGHLLSVNASIGIAVALETTTRDTLFRYADIALYEAKRGGGGTWKLFAPDMEELLLVHTRLQREMRAGFDNGEFTLVYQPLMSIRDHQPTGFEALMRWHSPALGDVSPSTFIPVAESSGMILQLGRWALREATRQLAEWQVRFGNEHLTMSVNASVAELLDDDFATHVIEVLHETGIEPRTLQIEVTESILADDDTPIIEHLDALRTLGVRVALDDFGTGYSSMSQLQALPVDCLKIDQAFIHAMGGDEQGTRVVHALIELGKALGLTVIAEGVENTEQLDALRDPECDIAQGFLLAKPMPVPEVIRFMNGDGDNHDEEGSGGYATNEASAGSQ